MKSLRIYGIIIIAILLLSIYLPSLYKDIFATRIDVSKVYYSQVDKEFIKMTTKKGKNRKVIYSNVDGTEIYTQDEYKAKMPFMFYTDLLKIEKFPKEFMIFAQDARTVRLEKGFVKIKPSMVNKKWVNLHPLIESKPKYASLKLPKDLFRLNEKGITFITTSTNTINQEKTQQYNKEFLKQGAVFPLKNAFGNPSTRKSFDEGYFITDAKEQLFHLKRVENKPVLNKVQTNGIKIKYIQNKENARREFYGVVVSEDSKLYLLMYEDYELVELPIENFDYKTMSFRLYTTPINRVLTIEYTNYNTNEKVSENVVTNLDYEKTQELTYTYSLNRNIWYETIKDFLFPFKTKIVENEASYIQLELNEFSQKAFMLFSLLAFGLLMYVKISEREIKAHIVPAFLIAVGGVYSLLVLVLFNKLLSIKKTNITKGKK